MYTKFFINLVLVLSVCCALLLFIAVLHAPREYYWLLRTVVSIGSILVIIRNISRTHWVLVFGVILILFNPIYPIYLYKKMLWIPIDIVTGLLFLVEIIINRPKKEKLVIPKKETKTYKRDRIL